MNEHQTQSSSTDSLYAKEVIVGRKASIDITRPRTDDRRVWDVVFGVYGFPAVLLAHKLKLFSLLAIRPRSLSQVCEALGIKRRPAEAILTAAVALGFSRASQWSVLSYSTYRGLPSRPKPDLLRNVSRSNHQ